MNQFKFEDCYISYVNLGHRSDRFNHMNAQLAAAGIKAVRTDGVMPHEIQYDVHKHRVMWERTKGALGCWTAQVNIMKEALRLNKSAVIFEDDCVFCSDIQDRLRHIETFIDDNDPDFDVVWLGGTVHVNPAFWHGEKNLDSANSHIGQDAQVTSDPRMLRTFGAFSTYAYIVNVKSLQKIIDSLDAIMHESMGIDWAFIKMQPNLRTYMYVPGCVKQMDNQSDIGGAMTVFSNFSAIGPYWWQDRSTDFDPISFNWAEAVNKVRPEAEKPVLHIIAPPELTTNISKEEENITFKSKTQKPRIVPMTIKNTSKDIQKIRLFDKDFHGNEPSGLVIEGYYVKFEQIFAEMQVTPYNIMSGISLISANIDNLVSSKILSIVEDKSGRALTCPLDNISAFNDIIQRGHLFGLNIDCNGEIGIIELYIQPYSEIILSLSLIKK